MLQETIDKRQVAELAATKTGAARTLTTPTFARGEWWFPVGAALVLLLITSIPYLYAWLSAPADKQFMGIMVNVPDHVQYFSWMHQFERAHLAANIMTPEPNEPIFFNLLWWGMARIGGAFDIDYAGMLQVMRWVATLLCLPLLYLMIAWFLKPTLWRRTAFLVATLGAGLGWLLVVGKYTVTRGELLWPLDLYVAEPNTFYSILASPHFIAALLYIAVFDLVLRGVAKQQWRWPVLAGLVALFLGWQHAYDLLIVYGVLAIWTLLWWIQTRKFPTYWVVSCLIVGVISVWPALYSVLLTSLDPLWVKVLAQFANAGVYTPPLYRLPILLGIPFVLALYGAVRARPWRVESLSPQMLLLQGWFWIFFILVYLPTDYQIHMLNGWQVPIAILTTLVLFERIQPWLEVRFGNRNGDLSSAEPSGTWSRWLAILLILAIIPTNLYLFGWRFVDLGRHDAPYYLLNDEVAALAWLDENADDDAVVMASIMLGQYVPAYTGSHAFLAHWAQTVDFYTKQALVDAFYAAETTATQREQIIAEFGVDYVLVGPSERAIGAFDPTTAEGMELAIDQGAVQVYRVEPTQ